ncbi:methyl-accepting chemotaxis protein [Saccharibacillus alkalitolerans]|uniref:Methyl-accepting chemotaxis protein n=1 Tax=Saccharibacillus alkalitolerans TaxID=2705290 RepID=A0ABX0F3Q3_9BACL|nr:methyl-accepting chemotaxis protein [Saccharibacillus alkalitolerans]NGZ75591.1 methyl-accepting chemotaxis protein [Saccharibacillus alkalitolerans]
MRVKSIKAKTLLLILPLLLVIVIGVSAAVIFKSHGLLLQQTEIGMQEQLGNTAQSIQNRIASHGRVPETLAKSIQGHYKKLSLTDYDAALENALDINKDTFGVGIYFEPRLYAPGTEFFSSYAFREQDQIKVTHDYSDPGYNYPEQPWYKLAVDQKEIKYTDPFYDDTTQTTMVTAAVPVYDGQDRFVAVTTGDINLNTVQNIVSETHVGSSGWAFMLGRDGTYLAGPDTDKVMKAKLQDDPDPALSALAKTILQDGEGSAFYDSPDGIVHVYFAKLEQTDWIVALALPDAELKEKINSMLLQALIFLLVGTVLIVAVILLYARNLTAHTARVNSMAEHLARGDFTYTIAVKTQDEFGKMAENLNGTSELLRKMMGKVTEHSLHVASTAEELTASADETKAAAEDISNTIQEVAAGAEQQLKGTRESATSLEELAAGIQRISESSSALHEASRHTSEQAAQGNEIIQQAVRDMGEANRAVSLTSEHMEQLRTRSIDIGNIIDVISGISTQTNLLSLNAGIEAARAGEHGRGFAVVAAEIGKLAEKTTDSAQKVREIIEEMQGDTRSAALSVENGTKAVYSSTALVEDAGKAFTGIVEEIRQIVHQILEVSTVSEQMSAGSQQISATMEELARISGDASDATQNVAAANEQQQAAMEEVSFSAKSLSTMVQELQELLEQFKI